MKIKAMFGILVLGLIQMFSQPAEAGMFELSGGYSYQRSNYNSGAFTWSTRWMGSIGYYLTQESQIEFMYQDTKTQNFVTGVQDVTFRDRVYSLNFVYTFFEGNPFRPYLRGGVGQLNRDASGNYSGGYSPPGRLDEVTVVLGTGFRYRITERIGIKIDGTSYLAGGGLSTWKDNLVVSVGGSFYF